MTGPDLAARWPLDRLHDVRDELAAAWDRDGYHDLRHLAEVLARIDELDAAGAQFDRVPVVLAAWFHDAVYDGQPGAEERSAAWAAAALPDPPAAEVARLVRMTEHHRPDGRDANGCVLSDADLAILAAPAGRYEEYAVDVRREYAHLPDEAFAEGRAAVLEDLLAKPQLFQTAQGRELWEERARRNVSAEVARLRGA